MGPYCVASHLAPFLPTHRWLEPGAKRESERLRRSLEQRKYFGYPWVYIKLMGAEGPDRSVEVRDAQCELHCQTPRILLSGALQGSLAIWWRMSDSDLPNSRPSVSRTLPNV